MHTDYKSSSKAKHARKVAQKSSGKKGSSKQTPAAFEGQPRIEQQQVPTAAQQPMSAQLQMKTATFKAAVVPHSQQAMTPIVAKCDHPQQQRKSKHASDSKKGIVEDQEDQPTFYDIDDLTPNKLE